MPQEGQPASATGNGYMLQLSRFPEGFPLGHVQLYAAAAAASVGTPAMVWVSLAKSPPYRPVAGMKFDGPVALHSEYPGQKAVCVEGIQPVTLLWKGSVSPGPAPGPAQGTSSG